LRRVYFGEHPSGRLGQARYLSLKDFEREYSVVRGDLARGIDPQIKTVAVDPQTAKLIPAALLPEELRKIFPDGVIVGTVGALLADYLQRHAASHLTPRGYLNYRQLTRSYLNPAFKVPVLQFGEEDVRALLSQVTRRAPQAVRHAKNVLSCAFAYGKEHIHGVQANPCQGVKVTVPKVRRDRWLTDSEIETVLETLPRMKNQKAADVYLLILASLWKDTIGCIRVEDFVAGYPTSHEAREFCRLSIELALSCVAQGRFDDVPRELGFGLPFLSAQNSLHRYAHSAVHLLQQTLREQGRLREEQIRLVVLRLDSIHRAPLKAQPQSPFADLQL
jgi:hypothetical protein